MLSINGKNLQANGQNVRLMGGWMQPEDCYFNGICNRYSDPTDWTSTANVAGLLNFMNSAADVMSDTSAKYGQNHGWYCRFVRVNTDMIGGWNSDSGLVNSSQFNGWIQNYVVPYAQHLSSRGLYLVLCATGPINHTGNGANNAGTVEQSRLITFWQTVANASGVKNANNIMFELMNEPVNVESSPGNGDWGNHQAKYYSAFKNWMQPVINAIRNTGANNVIWVPTLEWDGTPMQWAQYPFSGSNIGIACHFYPGYGGVHDNVSALQSLWNNQYQPAANNWPLIITECGWNPDGTGGLGDGSTSGFGNALKGCIDGAGNVSWLIGFLDQNISDLSSSTPANCTLASNQGAQAAFAWWYAYNGGGGGGGTGVTFYADYNYGGSASSTLGAGNYTMSQLASAGCPNDWASSVRVPSGYTVTIYADDNFTGTSWTLTSDTPSFGSLSPSANDMMSSCKITSGGGGGAPVSGSTYKIVARHSGKALDAYGNQTANGTQIIQWTYGGGSNQKWTLTDTGSGNWKIIGVQSGRAVDVS
ncbi:MAG: cellulase family glycosylhydrolase, partial [Verrucomicrobiota bacterium]